MGRNEGKGRAAVGGLWVWQRRKRWSMTQEQCEAASGVLYGRSASMESGIAEAVYANTVVGFTKALHVSAGYLLTLWLVTSATPGLSARESTTYNALAPVQCPCRGRRRGD